MKHLVAFVCLAFVACAFAADTSSAVISETVTLKESTGKLADHLKTFLESASKDKDVSKESKDRLKEAGFGLVDVEAKLGEQIRKLGEFLGLPIELQPAKTVP